MKIIATLGTSFFALAIISEFIIGEPFLDKNLSGQDIFFGALMILFSWFVVYIYKPWAQFIQEVRF